LIETRPESTSALDSAGKPRHDDCEFSVSRSRRLVIVAVADDPVGLDIEAVPEPAVAAEALQLVHPRERAELDQLSGPEMAAEFARLWARKEAFLRAMSTGLARDPGMDYVGSGPLPESPASGRRHLRSRVGDPRGAFRRDRVQSLTIPVSSGHPAADVFNR
jgi:hypothetical protein